MTVSCTKAHLAHGLALTEQTLGKNATLPVLEHLALYAETGRLRLSTTNLEGAVTVVLPAKTDETGSWTVPARVLGGLIRSLPDGPVQIKKTGRVMTIKGSGFSGKINCGNIDDFPIIPNVSDETSLVIETAPFFEALDAAAVATALTESRPELSGILLTLQGDELSVVATDTFRLTLRVLEQHGADEFSFILPSRAAVTAGRLFKDAKKVTLKVSENQCVFEEGDVTFISRLIEGSFPDFRAIIPEEGDAHIVVSRTVLLEHLDAATFFTSRLNDVILTITEGGKHLEVRAANNDVGEYTTEIKTEGEAVGETSAAFNIRYLADGVRTLKGETIRIELNGQQRPTVLRPTGDETQDLYLIMPIRTS